VLEFGSLPTSDVSNHEHGTKKSVGARNCIDIMICTQENLESGSPTRTNVVEVEKEDDEASTVDDHGLRKNS
jgi:hypothetical protein